MTTPPNARQSDLFLFSTHGIWGPGVKLMRHVGFTTKALLICSVFLVPIIVSTTMLFFNVQKQIAFMAKERVGVAYAEEVLPLLDLLKQQRQLFNRWGATGTQPPNWQQVREHIDQRLRTIEAAQLRFGADLNTAEAVEQVLTLQKSVPTEPRTPVLHRQVERHNKLIEAALGLVLAIQDGSGLTLDPELDTFYLMNNAYTRMPLLSDSVAQIRLLLERYVSLKEPTPDMIKALGVNEALGSYTEKFFRTGLQQIGIQHPDLLKDDSLTAPLDAMRQLYEIMQAVEEQRALTLPDFSPVADTAEKGFLATRGKMIALLDSQLASRISDLSFNRNLLSAVLAACLLLAGYLFFTFYLVMRGGLSTIRKHLNEIAAGDLRYFPNPPWGKDEPAELLTDLHKAYVALHQLIRRVRHSAAELHSTSNEMAQVSEDLSARSEASNHALGHQATTMGDLGETVSKTSETAATAARFASDNAGVAEKGGQVITSVVATMQGIHSSSAKISDITSVIDSIAFQTNILALNAAVEAARAGESGRGFAVVAAEVRRLAQRSASAAKEIKGLISESVQQIDAGTKVVQTAGNAMTEVVSNAHTIKTYMDEIAAAASVQTSSITQAVKSIQSLSDANQHNSALVNETTSAAGTLKQQAELLQEEIRGFRVT